MVLPHIAVPIEEKKLLRWTVSNIVCKDCLRIQGYDNENLRHKVQTNLGYILVQFGGGHHT